jgi:hypothetical protein
VDLHIFPLQQWEHMQHTAIFDLYSHRNSGEYMCHDIWNPRTLDKICIYFYIMSLNPLNVCYMTSLLIFVYTCLCHDKHVYPDINMYIQGQDFVESIYLYIQVSC